MRSISIGTISLSPCWRTLDRCEGEVRWVELFGVERPLCERHQVDVFVGRIAFVCVSCNGDAEMGDYCLDCAERYAQAEYELESA